MMFTVYCATTLFIDAHGGGTVITSFDQLKLLTKVPSSTRLCLALQLTIAVHDHR